ncbi:MAG: hypothetical protein Kow0037_12350 [Calditrichia bacterium]
MSFRQAQKIFFVLTLSLLWVINVLARSTDAPDQQKTHSYHTQLTEKLLNPGQDEIVYRFSGDKEIPVDEIVKGHLIVERGDLSIRGKVDGDVLVLWGNVRIYNTGWVKGDITSVGGKIDVYDNGRVDGTMLETDRENLLTRNQEIRRALRHSLQHNRYGTIPLGADHDELVFRYDRVDGAMVGLQFPKEFLSDVGNFSAYGFIGYAFKAQRARFQLGLDRWFFDPLNYRFEIGGEIHRLNDTQDRWIIPFTENTLAALFLREDFMDYFEREGYSIYANQNITPLIRFGIAYYNDDYSSLENRATWSLFGGDKKFRPNPLLGKDEGNMRSVKVQVTYDSRDDACFTTTGLWTNLNYEVSNPELGGDFDFQRVEGEIRYFRPLTSGESVQIRAKIGSSSGRLPKQKQFEFGGISTLRGYQFKQFQGNAMALLNVEYRLHPRIIGTEIPVLGDNFSIILFSDWGYAWNGREDENIAKRLNHFKIKNLKNSVGIALAHPEGDYRLNIAKRTDISENSFVITFRISQPF